jgi:hypothetical protein
LRPNKRFLPDTGFGADDGATLLMAFRGLQAETAQQGGAHKAIARELQQLVADPFEKWAITYHVRHNDSHAPSYSYCLLQERLQASRVNIIDGYVKNYEQGQAEVRTTTRPTYSHPFEILSHVGR